MNTTDIKYKGLWDPNYVAGDLLFPKPKSMDHAVMRLKAWAQDIVEVNCQKNVEESDKFTCDFATWMQKERYVLYWGSDGPNCNKYYKAYAPPDRAYYTMQELLNVYKKTLELKKLG
jgi:hypothetical protein